jgi:hypothetical protein
MGWILKLLHGNGLHFWSYSHGRCNRYYVCRVCGSRKVRLSDASYQPIDYQWLDSR